MGTKLSSLFDKQVNPLPLAVFRIAFSLVLFAEIGQMYAFRHLLFDPVPYVLESIIPSGPLLWVWLASASCLLLGYRTRLAAASQYVLAVILLGFGASSHGRDWQSDSLLLTSSLLLVFMPAGRALSVDRLLERKRMADEQPTERGPVTVGYLHTAFLVLTVGLFYLDSAFFKLSSPMYLNGLGVWAPASLAINAFYDASWLTQHPLLVQMMSYTVTAFETLFIFLFWFRPLRLPLIAAGIAFHLGVMAVLPIPVISLMTVSLYLGMVPAGVWERTGGWLRSRRPSLAVYYDRLCPLCRRTAAVLEALDPRGAVSWKTVQEHAADEPKLAGLPQEDLLHDIRAVDARGHVYRGAVTYAAVFRAAGWLWPLGLLLSLWPVRSAARRIYEAVAERRAREGGCRDGVCSLRHPHPSAGEPGVRKRTNANRGRRLAYGFLAAWLFSFGVILLGSPVLRVYVLGDTEEVRQLKRLAEAYKGLVYPWTGWTSHNVFMDEQFEDYRFQTMLVYEKDGREEVLPMNRRDGGETFTGGYTLGRLWEVWTFETARPGLPMEQTERNLLRFAAYWVHRYSKDMTGAKIHVLQRPQKVSLTEWKPDRLRENLAAEWISAGDIEGAPGSMRLTLKRPAERWTYFGGFGGG
ncbi:MULTISPECIES: DCC1-like thiol-disulfide oxidoreductase family protein [Paenibacillus]|uniref:DCC1-like thiol-disulfide oxidoreductase family protein n=1 Tax=Paenibacillus TaxID=44249 RepID=UPI0022B8F044|nr:DCC1-like thiol-disulfide oxidoreductase family protein [Paenibacillus caseinilyticus]MCZ8521139.1 DCC1-like thiol-disulfide oxidoreductase family protein [Paenibacillus caseinilyticus]